MPVRSGAPPGEIFRVPFPERLQATFQRAHLDFSRPSPGGPQIGYETAAGWRRVCKDPDGASHRSGFCCWVPAPFPPVPGVNSEWSRDWLVESTSAEMEPTRDPTACGLGEEEDRELRPSTAKIAIARPKKVALRRTKPLVDNVGSAALNLSVESALVCVSKSE